MSDPMSVRVGDVVKLTDPVFEGYLMVVTKLKKFGVYGYIPSKDGGAQHMYHDAKWDEFEIAGRVVWAPKT